MAIKTKVISVRLATDQQNMIAEIVKRTGETKVSLFERIIAADHKRIINGETLNESVHKQLEELSQTVNEMIPIIKKTSDNTNSIREGVSRIYCSVLFNLKELLRTMHFISGCFSKTSLLRNEQLSIISTDADTESINSYNAIFKILSDSNPKDILEMLRKK